MLAGRGPRQPNNLLIRVTLPMGEFELVYYAVPIPAGQQYSGRSIATIGISPQISPFPSRKRVSYTRASGQGTRLALLFSGARLHAIADVRP